MFVVEEFEIFVTAVVQSLEPYSISANPCPATATLEFILTYVESLGSELIQEMIGYAESVVDVIAILCA